MSSGLEDDGSEWFLVGTLDDFLVSWVSPPLLLPFGMERYLKPWITLVLNSLGPALEPSGRIYQGDGTVK